MADEDRSIVFGPGMRQLIVEGRSALPLTVADTAAQRRRGLLGSDRLEGALWLQPCSSVHTFGMRYAIDVALLDRRGRVLRVRHLRPGRMTMPSWRVRVVVEAPPGALEACGVRPGVVLGRG